MKKMIVLVAVAASMMCGFTACKKTCTCTYGSAKVEIPEDDLNKAGMSCKDYSKIMNELNALVDGTETYKCK